MSTKDVRLVISGSGLRYPVFVGAIIRLLEAGYRIVEIAGVSGGAIVASAFACGITNPEDLKRMCRSINPAKLLDSNIRSLRVFAWPFNTDGLYRGDKMLTEIAKHLPRQLGDAQIPLHIVTFNLELGEHVVWSSRPLSQVPQSRYVPGMDLPMIVRASMSLPVIFNPIPLPWLPEGTPSMFKLSPKSSYPVHLHVDGGVGANFPLNLFGTGKDVIGLRFRPSSVPRKINNKVDMVLACIDGLIESTTREHTEEAIHARQIYLDTDGGSLDFDLSPKVHDKLMADGMRSVDRWLKSA